MSVEKKSRYKIRDWDEEVCYFFDLEKAIYPEVKLPPDYRFRIGGKNQISTGELKEFGRIYGGNKNSRITGFFENVGRNNDFFMIWVYWKSEIVGSSLCIMEPEGKCRIEWSNIMPKHRKKGLYRNLSWIALDKLKEYGMEKLRFTLSERWLLPFWLKVFGEYEEE